MMKHFYTSSEAQQQLGINVGAFYYLIQTGKIKKIALPGKKRGFYSKDQIERLAREKMLGGAVEKEQGPVFMKATMDDIHEEYELATLLLNGSAGYRIPIYQDWLRKNPDTNFIVKDHGRIVAFMHILPVRQEIIKRWMKGEIREWEISAVDVLPYSPNTSVDCIIMGMATTSDVDKQTRHIYGMHLVRGYLKFLEKLAQKNITVNKFCAINASSEGIATLKQAKFEEKGRLGKRVAFELDTFTADSRLAKAYRNILTYKSGRSN